MSACSSCLCHTLQASFSCFAPCHAGSDAVDMCCCAQVLMGNAYSGSAVDVWSAGVTLYTLCAGQFPVRTHSLIPTLIPTLQPWVPLQRLQQCRETRNVLLPPSYGLKFPSAYFLMFENANNADVASLAMSRSSSRWMRRQATRRRACRRCYRASSAPSSSPCLRGCVADKTLLYR